MNNERFSGASSHCTIFHLNRSLGKSESESNEQYGAVDRLKWKRSLFRKRKQKFGINKLKSDKCSGIFSAPLMIFHNSAKPFSTQTSR